MLEVFLDALKDSAIVFGVALVIHVLLSFFEDKIVHLFEHHKKVSPIIGATAGLIPQCGISVVASDLYLKEEISMGTIFAVFFACSDEALPILISSGKPALYALPLIGLKFVGGFLIGLLIDLIIRKTVEQKEFEVPQELKGCCGHHIHAEAESPIHEHLVHPLLHSLKIFLYVFVVNMAFGTLIYFITEERIMAFLSQAKWITPLVSVLVGLIPNCASSVLLTELFLLGGLPFGALFSGLSVNAGLGLVYLLKNKKAIKDVLILESSLIVASLLFGYSIMIVMGLF